MNAKYIILAVNRDFVLQFTARDGSCLATLQSKYRNSAANWFRSFLHVTTNKFLNVFSLVYNHHTFKTIERD